MFNHSFFKFLIVGVINTIVGLTVMFICLKWIGLNYWVSTFIGNSMGAVFSFFLNKKFTFESNVPLGMGFLRFIAVILVCYFISYRLGLDFVQWILGSLEVLVEYTEEIAVLIGSGFYTITNYFGQRYLVFNRGNLKQAKG